MVGTSYGLSDNGWVDTELFKGWLTDHFIEHAVGARPILLLMDGHSSHFQPDIIQFARQYNIIMFCLPPHMTHESQPLDVSVFKSLKVNWKATCHSFIQSNPSQTITKYQFSSLLNQAWTKTMNPATICAGFRKCGVYPFKPDAIDCGIDVTTNSSDKDQRSEKVAKIASGENTGNHDEMQQSRITSEKRSDRQWSAEKIALFQQRYEEGYDLPDEDYIQWLHETHPDADNTSGTDFVSLADCFPDVPTATPVAVIPESPVEIPAEIENNKTSPDKATPLEAEDSEMSANRGVLPNNNQQSEERSVEVECDTAPLQKGVNAQPTNVLPGNYVRV